jgi:putative membrane protein
MIAIALILIVAALHFYFLYLEMFAWQAPRTRAAFGMTVEQAAVTKVLAANQGLYNGFLAAGLVWAAWDGASDLRLFFLGCVVVAGIYGSVTASRRILFIQAAPAALAVLAVLAGI